MRRFSRFAFGSMPQPAMVRTKREHTTSFPIFHRKETQIHRAARSVVKHGPEPQGMHAPAEKSRRRFERLVGD